MSNEVTTETQSIADVVRNRMETKIAELLPDEVFDQMLTKAVANLVEPQRECYSRPDKPPRLEIMIEEAIVEALNDRIAKVINEKTWVHKLDVAVKDEDVADAIDGLIRKHASTILTEVLSAGVRGPIQNALSQMASQGAFQPGEFVVRGGY